MPMTSARPSRSTRSAMRRSCSSNGCSASISRITTSAKRMALSASATESFSSFSSMRARRRSPAVSWMRKRRPRQVRSTAMASRVMPASGPVSSRSSPSSRLISVDLPVLGRPTTATRIGASARSGVRLVRRCAPLGIRRRRGLLGQRRAQRLVEIGKPLAVLGRDRDRIAEAERIGLDAGRPRAARPSLLLATRIAGLPDLRTRSAKARSTGVGPARASIRKNTASAAAIAASVCACMRPVRLSGAASSRPAVSITVKARSPSRARPSRRSRVTPGRSSTNARRLPTRRLNSVDLPTFGRPTMATVKLMSGPRARSRASRRAMRCGVTALCPARARDAISAISAAPADQAMRPLPCGCGAAGPPPVAGHCGCCGGWVGPAAAAAAARAARSPASGAARLGRRLGHHLRLGLRFRLGLRLRLGLGLRQPAPARPEPDSP